MTFLKVRWRKLYSKCNFIYDAKAFTKNKIYFMRHKQNVHLNFFAAVFFKVNVSHIKLIWQFFFHVTKRREKTHKMSLYAENEGKFIYFMPHAWCSFSGRIFMAWNKRLLDTDRLVCHDFSGNTKQHPLLTAASNPSQILSNEEKAANEKRLLKQNYLCMTI